MKRTVQLINSDGDLIAVATRDGEVLAVQVRMANDDEAIQALWDVLVPFAGQAAESQVGIPAKPYGENK